MFGKQNSYPKIINAVFSLDGFVCLKLILSIYEDRKSGDLFLECDKALVKLGNILATSKNEYEKTALKISKSEARQSH